MTDTCASCHRDRPIATRGLCDACRSRCRRDHTIGGWGQVRADRAAEYAAWRRAGASVTSAAVYAGVSERTGWRYEADLRTSPRRDGVNEDQRREEPK
jgi:hypothetical protein